MADDIDTLIQLLAKLPGLGPRSARRAALHLIKRRESLMEPLARAMAGRRGVDQPVRHLRERRHAGSLRHLH